MSVVSCFGNVIGLKREDATDISQPGSDSDSGFYLTDLEAIGTLEGLKDPESLESPFDQIESIFEESREAAVLKLNTDLTTLMMKHSFIQRPFRGRVGSVRTLRSVKGGGELVILCRPMRDATLKIQKVGLILPEVKNDVEFYIRSDCGTYNETYTIPQTIAKKVASIDVNLELPLKTDLQDYMVYRIGHNEDHMHAKLVCAGCKRFSFDINNPRFYRYGLNSYVNVAGYNGGYINSAMGVVASLYIKCKADNVICNEEMDYTDPVANAIAQAIWWKTGSIIVWKCLRSPGLNRVLMQNFEDLREAAKYYDRQYNDLIRYISKNHDFQHDCLCSKVTSWSGHIK